jgi:hypothetical protein
VRTSVRQRVVTFSFRLQAPLALLRIYNADGLSGYVDAYRWLGRPL